MRICFISYEYPPDTGIGGIATYVFQIAALFSANKIDTEVICASPVNSGSIQENEFLTITKINCRSTEEFRTLSPTVAAGRHQLKAFDLIEVPEYGAVGLYIKDHLPDVPLITKLHTPRYLIKELNDFYYNKSPLRQLKRMIGRGYKTERDLEYRATILSDYILSPSISLKNKVAEKWHIPFEKIIHAPNPYFPDAALLNMPSTDEQNIVLYIGRLETRKGVYNLAKAIPLIIKQRPATQFIFLGKDSRGPFRERSMKDAMLKEIGDAAGSTTFIDHVPLQEIPSYIAKASICIFPSLWENFPNVCLEAMSAAKLIVASSEGGMDDILADIKGGILIDPHDILSITNGVLEIMNNTQDYRQAAIRCRQKIISYYSKTLVSELLTLYRSFLPVSPR
jgi:glycosyltransferase involved in cell wall biosynthesis